MKRFTNRAEAISAFPLPFELLVPELFQLLAHDAGLSKAACGYVVDPRTQRPEDFQVLNGPEVQTEGLRLLRSQGIWPAPSTFPSIERIVREGIRQRAFAGLLWGEGCTEEGPWTALWRERGVRVAYAVTAIAPSGRAAVGLFNLQSVPPQLERALAMGECLSPIIAACLDREVAPSSSPLVTLREAQIAFGADGSIVMLGVDSVEMLRDAGAGDAGAVNRMRARVEAAAKDLLRQMAERPEPATTGGPCDQAALRRGLFRLRETGPKPVVRSSLARTAFGAFELTLAGASDPNGELQVIGTLRQSVPRAVVLLRALTMRDAPAREIELVRCLDEGVSLTKAARQLGIAESTAETMLDRLNERFGVRARGALIDAMVAVGRTV